MGGAASDGHIHTDGDAVHIQLIIDGPTGEAAGGIETEVLPVGDDGNDARHERLQAWSRHGGSRAQRFSCAASHGVTSDK